MHGSNNINFTTTGFRPGYLPKSSVNLYRLTALARQTSNMSIAFPWMYLYKQQYIVSLLHHQSLMQRIQTLYVVLTAHFVMFPLSF